MSREPITFRRLAEITHDASDPSDVLQRCAREIRFCLSSEAAALRQIAQAGRCQWEDLLRIASEMAEGDPYETLERIRREAERSAVGATLPSVDYLTYEHNLSVFFVAGHRITPDPGPPVSIEYVQFNLFTLVETVLDTFVLTGQTLLDVGMWLSAQPSVNVLSADPAAFGLPAETLIPEFVQVFQFTTLTLRRTP